MVSSCTSCTATRLVLVSTSPRTLQVRRGSSVSSTFGCNRFPDIMTQATSNRNGIATPGSLRTRCISSPSVATADFETLTLNAVTKSAIASSLQDTTLSQSAKESSSSGWSTSELFLSSLFALGVSVSFLVGTASTSIDGTSPPSRFSNLKGPRGGPQMNSNHSFMGAIGTAGAQELTVKEEEEFKDVFAMGNRKPYDVSVSAQQGERETMEDEYFVAKGGRFAAVYDGHGGSGVSTTLRKRLFPLFSQHLRMVHEEESDGDYDWQPSIMSYVSALNRAFSQIDREIHNNESFVHQGSTAVAVAIHEGVNGYRTLVSGNIGDSRAILSRKGKAVDLTRDHKPNEEGEKARILSLGGTIQWDPYGKVHRVQNLSTSRALGDRYARPMVSGQVEIKQYPIMEDSDEFVLVASDGLWDVMTSQEVVEFVHQQLHSAFVAETRAGPCSNDEKSKRAHLRRRNMARCVANESIRRGSMDNVTVLIVWLREI